jgi:class 3 adenylate cyclase
LYVVLVKSQSGSSILLPRVATFIKVIYNFGDEGFAQAKTLNTKIGILRGSIHYRLELVSLTGMSNLLNSTYTFLFTDIESSTYLAQQFPDALPALLTRHHQILKEAIYTSHGQIFQIVGDAFCVAFQTAREAVDAALGAQRSLQQEVNEFSSLRVRMGIHTGVASPADMNAPASSYAGYLTLARTQRIMSIAHGGQILLSNATAELLRGQLPEGVSLRDMDEHHLKGLALPEHLWQIVVPGLPSEFPPLLVDIKTSNNLPVQLTSFIGREQEIGEIKILVDRTHMITLTGPGGTGKTRLSLQIAGEMLDRFVDGVWFVDLAPLTDATLVPQAVAAALRILEQPGRPMSVQLTEYLRPKKLLIVLDNCEHLVSACAQLASTLLQNCPELRMIASSREPLNIIGEVSYPVTPLPIPGLKEQVMLSRLVQYESVRLFVERAQTLQPRFTLTDANADAVAQICNRPFRQGKRPHGTGLGSVAGTAG